MNPIISIILPTYNRADLIPRAIQSVLAQTFPHFELVIIDDGSTDETEKVVSQFSDSRIRYFWQENQERSIARNHGLALSQGKLISFLDSDDEFLPGKLEAQVNILNNSPAVGITIGGRILVDSSGNTISSIHPWGSYSEDTLSSSLKPWLLSGPACIGSELVRREWLEKIGGFDTDLKMIEDVDLWFRLMKNGCKMKWTKIDVLKQYFHPLSSSNNIQRALEYYLLFIQKAYRDPNLATKSETTLERAQAEVYLHFAIRQFAAENFKAGCSSLVYAVQLAPSFTSKDQEIITREIESYAWSPFVRQPVVFIEQILAHLPKELQFLSSHKNKMLASAWHSEAVRFHSQKNWKKTKTALLNCLKFDPTVSLNRGIIAMLIRSLMKEILR